MTYCPVIAIALLLHQSLWYLVSLAKKRNDVADVAWGLGFIVVSWLAFALAGYSSRSMIVNVLVTVWGIRLARHIWRRTMGKPEDLRYAAWRREWGRMFAVRSYLQVFLLQGFLLFLIATPILRINTGGGVAFGIFDIAGLALWATGFLFEVVGDAQLTAFVGQPANKGKLMTRGLWTYTRHPNYFGEVILWWGIFIIALSLPNGIATVVSPLTITVLIIFVSGIPLLERKYAGRSDFEAYKKRTSAFFPLPPRT